MNGMVFCLRAPRLPRPVLLLMAIACAALPLAAGAQGGPAAMKEQATFCEGTYALCIKAPCSAIPTLDRLINYSSDQALCSAPAMWSRAGRWDREPARIARRSSRMAGPI
jgi:hypothetical protein